MTTLENLYYGKIYPDKDICDKNIYEIAVKDFSFNIEILRSYVPRDCHEQLDDLLRLVKIIEHEHGLMMFKSGFSIAMRLSAESYAGGEKSGVECPFMNDEE